MSLIKGEAEVKKGLEWLKNEVNELPLRFLGFSVLKQREEFAVIKDDVLDLINQLDEPEVLSKEVTIDVILDDLQEYVKEQQLLSSNVGLAHTPAGNDTHYRQYNFVLDCIGEYELSEELKELVPKQELPVVPTWFDEWWKDVTKGGGNLFHNIERFYDELFSSGTSEMYSYIGSPDNKKKLLNIIINELEYEVEKEQKYNIKFKVKSSFGTVGIFLYKKGDEVLAGDNFEVYYPKEDEYRLTEQEIRDFQNGDILFEHFAVKVEELEE